MTTLQDRLRLLAREPRPAARAILLEALPLARPDERPALCRALAADGHPAALAAAIDHLHRLPPADFTAVADLATALPDAAPLVLTRQRPDAISNLIELIRIRADLDAAAALLSVLQGHLPRLAEQAAIALLEITRARVGPRGRRRCPGPQRDALERLIVSALAPGESRPPPAVLIAAALMSVRPGPRLREVLEQPQEPAAFALRGAVEHVSDPIVRANLLNWLDVEVLRGSASRWLYRIRGADSWADVLSGGHLLLNPRRRAALRRIDRPVQCHPDLGDMTTLPPALQARLPHLVAGLDLSHDLRVRRLGELIALPSPVARWRALDALQQLAGPRADEIVQRFCFDRAAPLARSAATHLLERPGGAGRGTLDALARCPHDWIASRAATLRAIGSLEDFASSWLDLPPLPRRAAAHRHAATARSELRSLLGAALDDRLREGRLAAIDLLRHLRWVPDLETHLIEIVADRDPRVASAAASALAAGRLPARRDALRAALEHEDARVRANAIETLARIGAPADGDLLRPLARSGENRLRANAVRGLLRTGQPDGMIELKTMLIDDNPLHRISGLWVARRARQRAVAAAVEQLASGDSVPEVRSRARAVQRYLVEGAGRPPAARSPRS